MRPNIWKKAVKCSRGFWPALPASLIILAATVPSSASAMQADAATKAAMDKRASARTLLSTALKRIAANGNNAAALLDAGRASMALEDYRAALGFLLRAEQNAPRDGAIKAGLGTAMLHQENPRRALDYFGEAQLLKAPERLFIADRALAYDLLGQQEAAQRDYALALSQQRDDEIMRRYALSLGISGHTDQAIEYLAPMLNAQDRSAWRTRAMILAMNGRQAEAKSIVDATMPASLANNIWPYLAQMDRLTPAQLAEAAHFGRFPSGPLGPQRSAVQMAAASPQAAPAVPSGNRNTRNSRSAPRSSQAAQVAQAAPPPAARASVPMAQASRSTRSLQAEQTAKAAEAAQAALAAQLARTGQAAQPARPAQVAATAPVPNVRGRGPISTVRDTTASAATDAAARSRMQSTISAQSAAAQASATQVLPAAATTERAAPPVAQAPQGPVDDSRAAAPAAAVSPDDTKPLAAMASLGDIIGNLQIPAGELARSDKAVSADTLARLREEGRRAEQAAAAERAAKARAEAAAKAKADADAKAQAEAAAKAKAEEERKKANPSRMWVQVGSGSNAGALEFTFNRFAKKNSELFKSVKGGTADWGRTRRLLAGPFANRAAAQKFLTDFKAAEGDGFIFTSAVGEEVEPLK